MNDRNIDESIRKPRRTKGTPFYRQRHYYTLGILGLSAMCGIIYELWSETKKLRRSTLEGKFDYPTELKQHIIAHQWGHDPTMQSVLLQLQKKGEQEVENPQPQSSFSKLFRSPDL